MDPREDSARRRGGNHVEDPLVEKRFAGQKEAHLRDSSRDVVEHFLEQLVSHGPASAIQASRDRAHRALDVAVRGHFEKHLAGRQRHRFDARVGGVEDAGVPGRASQFGEVVQGTADRFHGSLQ